MNERGRDRERRGRENSYMITIKERGKRERRGSEE